ncbi:discoidin domain-containing protein [Streptomyces sp. NPDC052109]|uniref:discoidin domain-containing protein n=1 Tax=Streptomyces sp. NPDC052109 TaxID=3155527 RepID=UPI0034141008
MKPDPDDHAATRAPSDGATTRSRLRLLAGALTLAVGATGFLTTGPAQAATPADPGARYIYASPDGTGSACAQNNACSLTEAQAQVRKFNQNMQDDIVVQLAGGTYSLSKPLTFTAADSGHNGHQVRWQAAPGAHPVLSGGRTVSGWSLSDPAHNIWSAGVPADLKTRQLYVDGVRADVPRSATGLPAGSKVTATGYTVPGNSLQSVRNPADLQFMYHPLDWAQESCNAASITGTASQTTVTMAQPCWGTVQSFYGGTERADLPQYLANDYSFLSQPGQWYLDTAAHRIYYIPRSGQKMSTANAVVPVLQNLVTGAGTATASVHDMTFQGLTFEYATWMQPSTDVGFAETQANLLITTPDSSYNWSPAHFVTPSGGTTWNNTPYGSQAQVMPEAVEFHAARNISFARNTFVHLGGAGLGLDQGSRHNHVIGNVMTDISGNGLQVGSVSDPNQTDPNLIDAYNTVSNNYVHKVNVEFLGGVGMFFGYVRDTTISHNEIADLPYSGMSIGWGWGSLDTTPSIDENNKIINNYVHDVMQDLHDGGGIYALGPQPGGVISGNYIGNVVHDSGHVYLDQGSTGWTVSHNVMSTGTTWMRANPNSFDPSSNVAKDNYTDLSILASGTVAISGTTTVATGELPASIIQNAGLQPAYKDLAPTTPSDTQAPTAPQHLQVKVVNPTSLHLNWAASTDNVGVTGYEIAVNGRLVQVTATPGATLTGLTSDKVTKITVRARDLAANLSTAGGISVQMPAADTQAPTTPGTPTVDSVYPTTVNLSWPASTDDWGVTDYQVYRDGVLAATTTGTSAEVDGATPGQTAQYTVKAKDAAGNLSAASPAVSATTPDLPNLALHAPATALYLDGSTALMQPNSIPGYAVDGDPSTFAQATNQYAWQLQVDLGSSRTISTVVTTMPSDKFATEYNIATSQDGQNWTIADKVTGFMGGVSTQNLTTPVTTRYLRIVAVHPDGGGQTGGQMAISELAVYGS